MSSYDIAEQVRETLPGTEEILVQHISGYLVDEASEDDCILQVARYMLEFVTMDSDKPKPDVLEHLMAALSAALQDQLTRRKNALAQTVPKLQCLDKVLNMSKAGAMLCVNFESDVPTPE